ncbi:MAG: hypothetical protein AAGB22_07635, partial [Bacteroidota bacterium]
ANKGRPHPGTLEPIFVVLTKHGNQDIFRMVPGQSQPVRVTFDPARDDRPVYGEGTPWFFLSTRDGDWDLYRMDLDSNRVTNLSNDDGDVGHFALSPDGKQIVYESNASGQQQVYITAINGEHRKRLTYLNRTCSHPQFSPNGDQIVFQYRASPSDTLHLAVMALPSQRVTSITSAEFTPPSLPENWKIAFTSYRGGTADIYLLDADGIGLRQLTNSSASSSFPQWCCGRRSVLFLRSQARNQYIDYRLDLATGKATRMERTPIVEGALDCVYNADSSLVVFRKEVDNVLEWFLCQPDGSEVQQITRNKKNGEPASLPNATWSHSGRKIALLSGPDYYHQYLKVYDIDRHSTRIYTDRGYMNSGMKWAADDRHIFLNASTKATNYELWSVDLSTREMTQLTFNPRSGNVHFDVSPDGEWIVFESQRDQLPEEADWNSEIYIMRTDGTHPIRLTDNPAFDGRPVWFPIDP